MQQHKHPRFPQGGWLLSLSVGLWLTIVVMAFASCSRQLVRTRVVHDTLRAHTHDTLRIVDHRRDSIYHRDSIYFVTTTATPPAGQMLVKERTLYRFIHHRDTLWRLRTDTLRQVVKEQNDKQEKTSNPLRPLYHILALVLGVSVLFFLLVIVPRLYFKDKA